jgi:hypothetical protein
MKVEPVLNPEEAAPVVSEATVKRKFEAAALLMTIAAELTFAYLVGKLFDLLHDRDYTAWRQLEKISEEIAMLRKEIAELYAAVEIAKKECLAGILRAQNELSKRRPPSHKALAHDSLCEPHKLVLPRRAPAMSGGHLFPFRSLWWDSQPKVPRSPAIFARAG